MTFRHLAFALAAAWGGPALGDSCSFTTHVEGQSPDGRYKVRADFVGVWKGRVEDTRTGRTTEGPLEGLGQHAHFHLFVTDDRIAFFEPIIDRRKEGNLLVYDRDLKLLKRFTLGELLYDQEFRGISHSISHCEFTKYDLGRRRPFWLEGDTFMIHLMSRRTARVALKEPKIIPTPEFVPGPAEELEDSEPDALTREPDRKRIQGLWRAVDVVRGVNTDPGALEDDPVHVLVVGDRIALSGLEEDLRPFRLDSSARTIDLDGRKGIYSLKGGVFRLCFADEPGQPRPKGLDGAGFDATVYVLKRVRER